MEPKTAKIYYLPPLSSREKLILRAQNYLEGRGFAVKVVEARQLSSADRRALEQGGHQYPVVLVNTKFISIENLETELEKAEAPRQAPVSPSKPIIAPPDHILGVSPPGPRSIWKSPPESLSDSSSPRRYAGMDDLVEFVGAHEDERAKNAFDVGSPFHHPADGHLLLEEIDDGYMEQYPLSEPVAAPSRPQGAPAAFDMADGSPQSDLVEVLSAHINQVNVHMEEQPIVFGGNPAVEAPKRPNDQRTEKLIWLFNGIKQYCETAEFKRAVNLLGKTADVVETQARSLWSYLTWSKAPTTNKEDAPADGMAAPPPDTETTLTLLVVRTNWYGRDQFRFLRLEPAAFVRLRMDHEISDRTPYEHLIAAQVSGSIIKFRYRNGELESEDVYNFGDPVLARMIADSLQFLKGKGSVAVSFVGN